MLMHECGLANHHNPPNFLKYMLIGVGMVLRTGPELSPYLGCMRLETLLWFIVYDLSYMILFCGYELDSSTKMTGIYVVSVDSLTIYMLALMCQTKNLQYTCYRNYYYEIYTLWLSPESIRSSVLIERLILVAFYGHGRSTHVGIREGENGHGGLEKRERV